MKKIEFKPYTLVHTDNVDIYEVHSLFIDEDEKSIDLCDEWNMSMGKIYYEDCKTVECLIYDENERLTGEIKTIIKNKGDDTMNEAKIIKRVNETRQMINKVEVEIKKYLNVELIDICYNDTLRDISFELHDFLDKPGNFEEDIECILHVIQPVIPTDFTVSHRYYNDQYWDGEQMTDCNLSCELNIKYVGDNQ